MLVSWNLFPRLIREPHLTSIHNAFRGPAVRFWEKEKGEDPSRSGRGFAPAPPLMRGCQMHTLVNLYNLCYNYVQCLYR